MGTWRGLRGLEGRGRTFNMLNKKRDGNVVESERSKNAVRT